MAGVLKVALPAAFLYATYTGRLAFYVESTVAFNSVMNDKFDGFLRFNQLPGPSGSVGPPASPTPGPGRGRWWWPWSG